MSSEKVVHTIELTGEKPPIMIQESVWKGSNMINLVFLGGGYPVQLRFGVAKVKMILHSLPELKKFYDENRGKLDAKDGK